MKDLFIDVSFKLGIQLAIYFYIIITSLYQWLEKFNMHMNFLYLGLIGTILSTLISIYVKFKNSKETIVVITKKSAILAFLELIIGPLLTMVLMSFFFYGEITKITTALAVGLGAFWEIAWKIYGDKLKSTLNNIQIGNKQIESKTLDDGELRPGQKPPGEGGN